MAYDQLDPIDGHPIFLDSGGVDIGVDPTEAAAYAGKVGNRVIGTTTERNAYPYKREGLSWYDTTLKAAFTYLTDMAVPDWYPDAPATAVYSIPNVIVGSAVPIAPPQATLAAGSSTPLATKLFTPIAAGQIRLRNAGGYGASYVGTLESAANARSFLELSAPGAAARDSIPGGEDRLNVSLGTFRCPANSILSYAALQQGGARQLQNQQITITYLGPLV